MMKFFASRLNITVVRNKWMTQGHLGRKDRSAEGYPVDYAIAVFTSGHFQLAKVLNHDSELVFVHKYIVINYSFFLMLIYSNLIPWLDNIGGTLGRDDIHLLQMVIWFCHRLPTQMVAESSKQLSSIAVYRFYY